MENSNNPSFGLESTGLFSQFQSQANPNCEVFDESGQYKPHWAKYFKSIENMSPDEIQKRLSLIESKLVEHGATYNLFGDSENKFFQWELDLIPMFLPFQEFQTIQSGLIQRARLFNMILKDIYSEQNLLKQGLLPPELIFANPNFIRPCTGIEIPNDVYLIFSATDLCKSSDGTWLATGDSTQTLNGSGFALENRIILSQVLSSIYHQHKILRIAPYFIKLQEYLTELAFYKREVPSIVLLTPGPSSATYFEHAFLSRYLGYPLVESGDLTVRDNKVYMKTLDGLEPVDIIVRWISDDDSDPLALRTRSTDGLSGMIHAAQTQNVIIANPIGTGVIESPAFLPYLPNLCQHLLGEDLIINSIKTLWCGNPASLDCVLNGLDQYIIRTSFTKNNAMAIDPETITMANKESLVNKIKLMPYRYVAQEKTNLSTIPTLQDKCLTTNNALCRFYISAIQDDFQVMPGGLARVSDNMAKLLKSKSELYLSKDIWVLSEGPIKNFSLMGRLKKPLEIRRTGKLPSRVADHLLWLGRYLERAENQIRILRGIFSRLSGEIPFLEIPELPMLLNMAVEKDLIANKEILALENINFFEIQKELRNSIYDSRRPESLISTLQQVQRSAKSVRDRLSIDSWRVLMRLDNIMDIDKNDQWRQMADSNYFINEVLIILSAFSGLAMEGMTRALGWRFMDMGRRIERADYMISIIQCAVARIHENTNAILDTLLEFADSSMTYRSRYRTYLQLAPVMDLLLSDEINPKSLVFQISALSKHVKELPNNGLKKYSTPEEKCLLSMKTAIRLADIQNLCTFDTNGKCEGLESLLSEIEKGTKDFAQHVTQHYLSRIPSTQHFMSILPEGKNEIQTHS